MFPDAWFDFTALRMNFRPLFSWDPSATPFNTQFSLVLLSKAWYTEEKQNKTKTTATAVAAALPFSLSRIFYHTTPSAIFVAFMVYTGISKVQGLEHPKMYHMCAYP